MSFPPFPPELLSEPDNVLGDWLWTWWVGYQFAIRGIKPEDITPEGAENLRVATIGLDTNNADQVGLEKALRLAATGDRSRAGKMFRDSFVMASVTVAALDEAVTGKRRQRKIAKEPRPDPLQLRIIELLRANPRAKQPEILNMLKFESRGGIIDEVSDGEIWFIDANGKGVPAPISGLKDRISRAKKLLKAETESKGARGK